MENIRKVVAKKRVEQKKKYKKLRLQAWEMKYDKSQELRKIQDEEWKKFKFLCDLEQALDKKE